MAFNYRDHKLLKEYIGIYLTQVGKFCSKIIT